MHRAPTHATTHREAGIGLVEILVVMAIIAIVSTFAIMGIRGARESGGRTEAVAAATRYGDAVDRFQQEHARRLPVLGSASWPVAKAGPIYVLQVGSTAVKQRPYLKKGVPEVMDKQAPAGAVLLPAPGGKCPTVPTDGGALVYRTGPAAANACGPKLDSAYQYSIGVFWDGTFECSVGDVPPGRRC